MRMWRFVRAGVSIAAAMTVAFLSTAVRAQIPERGTWEITFDQVEAAAGLSDMRTARPETFEVRLMQRP